MASLSDVLAFTSEGLRAMSWGSSLSFRRVCNFHRERVILEGPGAQERAGRSLAEIPLFRHSRYAALAIGEAAGG